MLSLQMPKAKLWLRSVALLTALIFTFTSVGFGADGTNLLNSLKPENKIPLESGLTIRPTVRGAFGPIDLPAELGQIKKSYQGSSDRLVIHIER